MRRLSQILFIAFVFSGTALGQVTSYKVGEKVNYLVHYGPITGGEASLELISEKLDGKEVWHSVMLAKTTGMTDAFFKVLDIYEVYIDPATQLPVKSIRNVREGRYRKYNVVLFDHKTRADSAILTSDLTGVHIAPPGIHDIVSCFYYLRNNILNKETVLVPDKTYTIMTWFTDELYPIILRYKGVEEIKTKLGRIKCYKFNPVTEVGRLFKTEEDVSFWFSADKNFLPVKIRFDIFVGSFNIEIVSYEGTAYPLEIVRK
jgi:hypothetical protein